MAVTVTPRLDLKRWRVAAGLTQAALAERVGVTQALVSVLESGAPQSINFELWGKLADALGVLPHQLISDTDED